MKPLAVLALPPVSSALPTVTALELIRALGRAGFVFKRQKGSHQTTVPWWYTIFHPSPVRLQIVERRVSRSPWSRV